jgi:signal peptidase
MTFKLPRPWGSLVRGLAYGSVAAAVLLASLFALARTWPPVVVVETGSMQHDNQTSFIGVADTGDIVLVQAVPGSDEVVTYVEGRAQGQGTYGDFGDVIIFQRPTHAKAVIHRPLVRLLWNETAGGFDIPSLLALERGVDWNSTQTTPHGLKAGDSVTLYNATFQRLTVRIAMDAFLREIIATRCVPENPCYVTMGDNNAPVHDQFLVRHSWILGRARGEVPWIGLLKLVVDRTYGWGDSRVPANSWTFLGVTLSLLIGGSVGLEFARTVRAKRRRRPQGPDEGGLGEVVSKLEARWTRPQGEEGEGSGDREAGSETDESSPMKPGERPPPD